VRSTARNVVSTTRIENAKTAIDVVGAVDIADSVLSSGASFRFDPHGGPSAYAGLHLSRGASARVSRSAITGFNGGIVSQQAAALSVTDTIVRHNYDGMVLYGSPTADDGFSCQPPPAAPTRADGCNPLRTWDCSTPDRSPYDDGNIVEDPVITNDDIVDNFDDGIQVGGHMVLQLSHDNFANGIDLSLMTDTLDPASFVRSNNFSTREPLPAGYTPRTLQNPSATSRSSPRITAGRSTRRGTIGARRTKAMPRAAFSLGATAKSVKEPSWPHASTVRARAPRCSATS
jgi:hypothetical protein